jgi:hypothetical protein
MFKKENLKAAKMPAPKGKPADDDMLSMEGEEDAEASAGEESPAEEAKELAAMPDEVLLAELKKRGYEVESAEEEQAEGEEGPGEAIAPPKPGMPDMKAPKKAMPF